jgi:hypothetical protein
MSPSARLERLAEATHADDLGLVEGGEGVANPGQPNAAALTTALGRIGFTKRRR